MGGARVPSFAKLVDVAGATAKLTAGDRRHMALVLRKVGGRLAERAPRLRSATGRLLVLSLAPMFA